MVIALILMQAHRARTGVPRATGEKQATIKIECIPLTNVK
jgi:hypothetical protein